MARWDIEWWVADTKADPPVMKGPLEARHIVKRYRGGWVVA